MSANELAQLKNRVGDTIAMTSFIWTTKNPDVANIFAGYGEGRPTCESVIFEIIIDECQHDYERSPFADISALSSKEGEEEVLLCVGTMLTVESVDARGQVTWACVRMCQRKENDLLQQTVELFDAFMSGDWNVNEASTMPMFTLCYLFVELPLKLIHPYTIDASMDPVETFWLQSQSPTVQLGEVDPGDADFFDRFEKKRSKLQELARSALDSRPFEDRLDD